MEKLEQLLSPNNVGELFEAMHAMIALVDHDGVLVSWNRAFGEYKKTDNLEDVFFQNDRHHFNIKLATGSQEHWVSEMTHNRDVHPVYCDCFLLRLGDDRLLFIAERIAAAPDLSKLIERLSRQVKMFRIESQSAKKIARNKQIEMESVMIQAREVAQIDALTFLLNRRMIVRELQDEVLRAGRYGSMLSVSVVDVDNFKRVNDRYGHSIGDEVLKHVAYQLRDHIRHPDTVGRYGGEEFLILLPNSDSKAATEQAIRLGREIREAGVTVKEYNLNVTVSIGIAQFKAEADTWDSLLNRADNAMYEAKRKGRDCWVAAD